MLQTQIEDQVFKFYCVNMNPRIAKLLTPDRIQPNVVFYLQYHHSWKVNNWIARWGQSKTLFPSTQPPVAQFIDQVSANQKPNRIL